MPRRRLLGHHHDDDEDWRLRRGRFAGLDPDTEDRPQVKPVLAPEVMRQTHNQRADLTRPDEDDHQGGGQ